MPTNHGCGCVLSSLCSCRLSISLSLSLSPSIFLFLVFLLRRSLTHCRFSLLYTSFHFVFSPFFAPFSVSFRCVDIFFLFLVCSTFTTMPFFFPCLFIPFLYPFLFLSRIHTRIFLLPYFSSYSLLLPFTYSLSRAFSVPLAPTPSTLTHSAFFLVRLLTRSVSFTALSSLSDSRGWSGSLFARQPSPPLSIPYCHLVIVPRIYESSRVERC